MQPTVRLFGLQTVATDFLFLGLVIAWLLALAARGVRFVWHPGYWFIALYFAAMLVSLSVSDQPRTSLVKLATQVYLLSLPVLAATLIRDHADVRRAIRWWLAGTAVVVLVGALTLTFFPLDRDNPLLRYTLFHFGTLPPGDYPRVRLTFLNANMLCNYLTASLLLLLVARRLGWVSAAIFALLLPGILICAVFTISPGLGGIALAVGVWLWLLLRETRRSAARIALAAGLVGALLFIPAMTFTPILHPTAPFLVQVPFVDVTLAPAGRLMIWMDAVRNFAADPFLGRGIGADAVLVRYQDPGGNLQRLTDAHNMFLNIGVQCGIVGLSGLCALIAFAWRRALPFRLMDENRNLLRLAVGFAFLNCLVYHGLGGSFEDARHIWLLFGLLLAADRIERAET
jgi:O-antigen ligase